MKIGVQSFKRCCVILVFAIACLGVDSQSVNASPVEEAQSYYQLGQSQFEQGLFSDALASFFEADKLAPAALMDFNIALCYESMEDVDKALKHYKQFLTRSDDDALKSEVRDTIAGLEASGGGKSNQGTMVQSPQQSGNEPSQVTDAQKDKAFPPPPSAREDSSDLARVRSIEVSSIRDQRRYLIESSKQGQVQGAGVVTDASGNSVVGGNNKALQEPMIQQNNGQASSSFQHQPVAPVNDNNQPKAKPIYKNWLFWVVVAVAAYVVIDIADTDSGNRSILQQNNFDLPSIPGASRSAAGGAPLFRF